MIDRPYLLVPKDMMLSKVDWLIREIQRNHNDNKQIKTLPQLLVTQLIFFRNPKINNKTSKMSVMSYDWEWLLITEEIIILKKEPIIL